MGQRDSRAARARTQPTRVVVATAALLTVEEAAERLAVSKWTVRRLIAVGILPVVRLKNGRTGAVRRLLIDSADVEDLIARCKQHPAGK
jgi:excisionase family DNA binding protein